MALIKLFVIIFATPLWAYNVRLQTKFSVITSIVSKEEKKNKKKLSPQDVPLTLKFEPPLLPIDTNLGKERVFRSDRALILPSSQLW